MALLQNNKKQFIYLYEHHTFGRLEEKVDTLVQDGYVSRIHAIILWQGRDWKLRDLSSNGTWLNNERIPRNQLMKLSIEDKIQFGDPESTEMIIIDLAPPVNALVRESAHSSQEPEILPLDIYHFFPNEEQPELVLFKKNNLWYKVQLDDSVSNVHQVQDKEKVVFSNSQWTLRLLDSSNETILAKKLTPIREKASLEFELSLDEEHCNLSINLGERAIDLGSHSHHLMTLMLARYRSKDTQKQVPEADRGWVYLDQLSRDIGLEERHINIQIHRARKQLAEKLATPCSSTGLIERRRGQLRLGIAEFKIHKGDQVEYSST